MSSSKTEQPSVLKNSAIIMVAQFAGIFVKFFTNILLAWFLTPDAFGIAAIVLTIFMGLQMLSDVGILDSIIRSKNGDKPDFYLSAFVIQVLRGIFLYLIVFLLASPIANFYGEEILRDCLMVGGFSLVIEGFFSTRLHVMQRNHQVTPLLILELVAQLITAIVIVAIAINYPSVWALVIAHIVHACIKMTGSHYIAPLSFKNFKFKNPYYMEIFGFGKWIFLATLFHFVITQSDKLILGKLVDPTQLGIYSLASALTAISMMFCYQLGQKVLYPVLSQAARNSESEDYSARVQESLAHLLPVLLIFCLLTFALAPTFFDYLYKDAYQAAGRTTQYLAFMTWFMILYDLHQKIPVSYGSPMHTALFSGITAILRVALSIVGYRLFGIPGFVLGLSAASILGVGFIQLWMAKRHIAVGSLELKLSGLFLVIFLSQFLWHDQITNRFSNELYAVLVIIVVGALGYWSYRAPINRQIVKLRTRFAT